MLKIFCLTACCFLIFAAPAQAYLDPGTASMLLQALAAAAVGLAVFWRNCLNFIKKTFGKKPPNIEE
ncbi:MAG: hypothetical protein LBS31_08540 [Candidatus Adiutrix sp.]|jgi:hypothetical protein|nr:hypothetical protein [Candidatus Adiutrix sp.]